MLRPSHWSPTTWISPSTHLGGIDGIHSSVMGTTGLSLCDTLQLSPVVRFTAPGAEGQHSVPPVTCQLPLPSGMPGCLSPPLRSRDIPMSRPRVPSLGRHRWHVARIRITIASMPSDGLGGPWRRCIPTQCQQHCVSKGAGVQTTGAAPHHALCGLARRIGRKEIDHHNGARHHIQQDLPRIGSEDRRRHLPREDRRSIFPFTPPSLSPPSRPRLLPSMSPNILTTAHSFFVSWWLIGVVWRHCDGQQFWVALEVMWAENPSVLIAEPWPRELAVSSFTFGTGTCSHPRPTVSNYLYSVVL